MNKFNKLNPLDKADITVIVEEAQTKAQVFKNDKLKTNQIRNFYSAIAQMRIKFQEAKRSNENEDKSGDEAEKSKDKNKAKNGYKTVKTDLIMLKPKLAYAAGRQAAVKANFYRFMTDAIQAVEASEDKNKAMENYFALIESVVGFHKYFGDK